MENNINVTPVNYLNAKDGDALLSLLEHYALDPMGGGEPLSAHAKARLLEEMAKRPTIFSYIAWRGSEPVGLINAVETFSTFAAKPVCNIHDIAVKSGCRGQGIAQLLLAAIKQEAIERGCCKLTLEVLTGNEPARLAYRHFGFEPYQLSPDTGVAEFWECPV